MHAPLTGTSWFSHAKIVRLSIAIQLKRSMNGTGALRAQVGQREVFWGRDATFDLRSIGLWWSIMKKSIDWLDALTLLCASVIESHREARQAEPLTARWLRERRSRRRMINLKSGITALLEVMRPRR
jgi:hypothetical protein